MVMPAAPPPTITIFALTSLAVKKLKLRSVTINPPRPNAPVVMNFLLLIVILLLVY
ncbi:hypothetical protein NC99_39150 [Sunxiuqinia dokdonensis]|uniref:Uncharacterized protein n=1 Tax=Sunxiuqinia dokdonensis TaxID=1409788 RepID=A0A0L8V464_9BACT|nr:hypothetical protein NC99_39150 [Sunxiuqinia dokdonensis]